MYVHCVDGGALLTAARIKLTRPKHVQHQTRGTLRVGSEVESWVHCEHLSCLQHLVARQKKKGDCCRRHFLSAKRLNYCPQLIQC